MRSTMEGNFTVTQSMVLSFDAKVSKTPVHIDIQGTRLDNRWTVTVNVSGDSVIKGKETKTYELKGLIPPKLEIGLFRKNNRPAGVTYLDLSDAIANQDVTSETVKRVGEQMFCHIERGKEGLEFNLSEGISADLDEGDAEENEMGQKRLES